MTTRTITARAYGLLCFEPRFTKGGKLFLDVLAIDRVSYVPEPYELRTAITRYPMSYAVDGGTRSCPPPDAGYYDAGVPDPDAGTDGGVDAGFFYVPGCQFTNQ